MNRKDFTTVPLHKISMSTENYLEAIYLLEKDYKFVRSIDLASYLGVSRASVSKALNSLKEEEYIEHQYYGQILLTNKGRLLAQSVLERHKLIYLFLTKCLSIDEKQADDEACLMEHTISQTTVDSWRFFLYRTLGQENVDNFLMEKNK